MARTLWLQTDTSLNGGQFLIDTDTRKAPVIADASALTVKLGAFANASPLDLDDFTSLNLAIYASVYTVDSAPLVSEDVQDEAVTALITTSAWNNRASSNATWTISAASMNFDLGTDTSRKFFMVISGTDGTSETILGASEIEVFTDQNPRRANIGYQRDWLTATAYSKNDLVRRSGSVYIAIVAHTSGTSTAPGTGADWAGAWDLFVAKGDTGNTGNTGNTGSSGPTGPVGPTGPGFTYREAWSSGVSYAVNDVTSVLGAGLNAYVCKQAHASESLNQPESGGSWTDYWFEDPILQAVQITGFLYNATLPNAAANMGIDIRITNSSSDPSGNTPGFNNARAHSDGTKWRYTTNGLTVNGA